MGIHFLCPNGHHLNVKRELAGKVGYCPKCRAKLIVPIVDESSANKQGSSSEEILAVKTPEKERSDPPKRSAQSLNASACGSVEFNDPNVLWWVRASDGEQYGPAVGSVIQKWIQERRIGPKTYVWRQGWENWEEAEKIFPEIREVFEASVADDAQENQDDENVLRSTVARFVDSYATGRSDYVQRKKKAINSFYVILGLIGLITILLVALIVVLFFH